MERIRYTEMLRSRLREKRRFIQVLAGPRQVGKSTIISDVLSTLEIPYVSESADDITISGDAWLKGIWDRARSLARQHGEALVAVDEIQKIANWSEAVKKMRDEDKKTGANVKAILSGSSRLLLMKGLSESLQGRFELIPIPHWSYGEMKEVFGFTLDEFIYFGSYPGPADLIGDERRWKAYIRDSIMEPSLTKDILMLTPIQTVSEEIFFRVLPAKIAYRDDAPATILQSLPLIFISGFIFMVPHLGNTEVQDASTMILPMLYYFIWGALAMAFSLATDGFEAPAAMHAVNNTFIALAVNYEGSSMPTEALFIRADAGTAVTLAETIAIFAILFIFAYRKGYILSGYMPGMKDRTR